MVLIAGWRELATLEFVTLMTHVLTQGQQLHSQHWEWIARKLAHNLMRLHPSTLPNSSHHHSHAQGSVAACMWDGETREYILSIGQVRQCVSTCVASLMLLGMMYVK
jgi:hypothetical protein